MKKNLSKIVLSVAFVAVAMFGAFNTNAMNKNSKLLMNQTGYIPLDEDHPCKVEVSCRTEFGPVCKSGIIQAWGKVSPSSVNCTVELYKLAN
jgi:hypothetical protein